MTDKDSQLDEIERLAEKEVDCQVPMYQFAAKVPPKLFLPGGLYYEMRRKNDTLWKCFYGTADLANDIREDANRLRQENERLRQQLQTDTEKR